MNVSLTDVSPNYLTFSWTQVQSSCRILSYAIDSTNCGLCPSSSNSTTVNCTNFQLSSVRTECRFAVSTVICENITGASRESLVTIGGIHNNIVKMQY